jgi:hypothetical protein
VVVLLLVLLVLLALLLLVLLLLLLLRLLALLRLVVLLLLLLLGLLALVSLLKTKPGRTAKVMSIFKRQDGVAAIGTAAGTFAAACMTAGAIHVYGTNMPERAPADAAPKSTCDIKESSGKENIRHNMGKIAVGRAASGAHTLTLPPAAATPPLALAA